MSGSTVGVDQVYDHLLERIITGSYPVGSRLPSCRAMARELGSNSSTVDRAIGRLASQGRVRTVARKGTFVEGLSGNEQDHRAGIAEQIEELLKRARRLGCTADELTEIVSTVLQRVDSMRRIAVVECNERDLRNVQDLVQRAIDVEVQPVLLSEAAGRSLDQEFDAVAVPIFHLNDVAPLVDDPERVVELNLVASPAALRQLVDVRGEERLIVVAPSARGIQWMTALVGQYFPGAIETVQLGVDDVSAIENASVVVVNNAAQVEPALFSGVGRLISIEWELDSRFVPALRSRIENVIATHSNHTNQLKRGAA